MIAFRMWDSQCKHGEPGGDKRDTREIVLLLSHLTVLSLELEAK